MSWTTVAKKEYLENVRNAWVITVSIAFFALTLLSSILAGAMNSVGGGGFQAFTDLVFTIATMQNFSGFLLPILALVLAFATIAGERESGSLALLVAQPLSRGDVVAGKWVGLWGVLATAILAGFGLGGTLVLLGTDTGILGVQVLVLFLLETLAWGAAWISIALLLSAFFQRRGTAIAGSIAAWFLLSRFVWNMLTLLLLLALYGSDIGNLFVGQGAEAPGWLILTQLLNPNAVYDGLLVTTIEGYPAGLGSIGQQLLPNLYQPYVFSLAMVAWIALPYLGAHALFHRKDV